MNKVVCSICSREKDESNDDLPARLRYRGSHVAKVARYAQQEGLPFFILSGVYGFISEDERIEWYDHLLAADEVPALARKIEAQLRELKLQEVHFYTKRKPNWEPYLEALNRGAKMLGIRILVHYMGDEA